MTCFQLRLVETTSVAVFGVDPQDLKSKGSGRAAIVSDYGVGITPKLQKNWGAGAQLSLTF